MFKKVTLLALWLVIFYVLVYPFVKQPTKVEKEQLDNTKSVAQPKLKPKPPEKPLHNVALPNFKQYKVVAKKKKAFFDFLSPDVEKQNLLVSLEREQVDNIVTVLSLELALNEQERATFERLRKKYRVSKRYSDMQAAHELLNRVDIIPASLVLVQAANESAWGTSRFARIGLNFFGIWCYSKGCGMVPNSRNEGANHEVQAFQSVERAVAKYLHNINTNPAYQVFRTIRAQLRAQQQPLDPEILATGLLPYSERGSDYVLEISAMIRHNQEFFELETTE